MAAEEQEKTEATANEAEVKTPDKGGMLKYIIIGGGAFVVVILIAVAVVFFLGGDSHEPAESDAQPAETRKETKTEAETPAHETSADADEPPPFYNDEEMVDEQDPSVIQNIMDNLAFLDYQPEESEIMTEEEELAMSAEDSVETVNWLEAEKAALAKREAALATRERDLKLLDKTVSKKLLTLEQAESSRVNNLARLYDGMDPRSVAQLMANLDDKTVVSLIPRMKIKNASAVLALMPPKRAAKLSKQMITIAEK